MGLVGSLVYLDANIFVYAMEDYPEFSPHVHALFRRIDRGELCAVTSQLTLAEVLVKPVLDRNSALERAYLQMLQGSERLRVEPISLSVLVDAARLRASCSKIRLPDAIHAATAITQMCSDLVTNDVRLRSVPGVNVVLLSELTNPPPP